MNLISPDKLLLIIFVLNTLLVLLDATVGYHLAPGLLNKAVTNDSEVREAALKTIRRMLSGLVALYMFFNCLGYFGGNSLLLMIVAGMIAVDLGVQVYLCRSSGKNGDQP